MSDGGDGSQVSHVNGVRRQVNAMDLAKTMTQADIEEAILGMKCDFCGAEPQQVCRSNKSPGRKTKTHSARGALLWAMWHKGYKAGRDRASSEQTA